VVVVGGTRFSVRGEGTDADGDSLTYTWNWDDGSPRDTGKGASHIFNKEGEYRVELTVEDGRGGKATDHTTITARKLSGTWRVENARHFDLSVNISQNNGPGVFGTMSDGAAIQGQVRDPYRITLTVNAANGFCIPSGNYIGTINPQVTEINFPGPGCRNFLFIR
jgi:PKD repeat protein